MKVNIAILNFNGKSLLEECLPSIIEAASKSRFSPKITVLDNCSTDNSVDFLKRRFPNVQIYIAKENKVYCSYNEFFKEAEDDVIVVLNSDIKVDQDFLDPLAECFENDQDVFFVSSKMYYFDGKTYQGDRAKAAQRFGIISADCRFDGYKDLIDKRGYTFSTGNGAFDRKKFLEVGGYDDIFLPGRYEDVDFCFRGWKLGYKGMYEPRSVIYHKGYESFKNYFSDKSIQKMVFKNSVLFTWKNITDPFLLFKFYFWLVPRLLYFAFTKKFYFLNAFWQACTRIPEVARKRKIVTNTFKLTDKQVLEEVG
jgi:GT2 family glycosyltransferase